MALAFGAAPGCSQPHALKAPFAFERTLHPLELAAAARPVRYRGDGDGRPWRPRQLSAVPRDAGWLVSDPHRGEPRFVAVDGSVGRPPWPVGDAPLSAAQPNAYLHGGAGPGHTWVATWTAPRLWLLPADGPPVPVQRQAPLRDGAFDDGRGVLWAVGPQQARVRRDTGPIRKLHAHLTAHPLTALQAGSGEPSQTFDLGAAGLVDGVRVRVLAGGRVAVVAAGSDAVWFPLEDRRIATGPVPQDVADVPGAPGAVAVLTMLDAAVTVYRPGRAPRRIALDPTADARPPSLADLGEHLFYRAGLWRTPSADAYTCNSCHWDTGSDHRVHPGFRERRHELTRPLGGIAMVAPIFTTGGAETLSHAIEGLVRSLDARMWDGTEGEWWHEPRTVSLPDGDRELSARQVREALLAFLMSLPVPRPALRHRDLGAFDDAARRGWDVFARDCAVCHAPVENMRRRERVPNDQVLARLERGPLAFGNPGWAKTGAAPYFTQHGNRISPLVDLSRGGPFFSDGSAATLSEVLQGHGQSEPARTADEQRALQAFLLSL